MKLEYLIFNLIIFLAPFLSSFFYPMIFPNNINHFLPILIPAVIFIFHDIKVNNLWWNFNKKYIINFKIYKLPIEEILFFFTVSFSCLTIWLNLKIILPSINSYLINIIFFGAIFLYFNFLYLKTKKPYPKFVFYLYLFLIILDLILKTNIIFKFNFLIFSIIVFFLVLIFNYYLTKRPIVIYNKKFKSNVKILTIPIEDFLYGFNFIYLLILLTELFSNSLILFK